MNIIILTGSPRKNGTTNYLVQQFQRGAEENGHKVIIFDTSKADIKNCIGCNACQMGQKPCIHKDDFVSLRDKLIEADMIVFATPMYYFGMSSTLKKVIDRFYSIDSKLKEGHKKSILISVQHAPADIVKEALNAHYLSIVNWLQMENSGIVNAIGIESVEQLKQTIYPDRVYELAKNI